METPLQAIWRISGRDLISISAHRRLRHLGRQCSRLLSGSPAQISILWGIAAILGIVDAVAFGDGTRPVSSTLYLSGTSIFAGLLIAWALRLSRSTALHLLSALLAMRLVARLAALALKLALPVSVDGEINGLTTSVLLLAMAFTISFGYGARRSRRRRAAAILLGVGIYLGTAAMLNLDYPFWRLSAQIQPHLGRPKASDGQSTAPDIDDDVLWGAQPTLIENERAALQPRIPGKANIYMISVAGAGTQALFSREAHEALRVAALHFGDSARGASLLSNGPADQMNSPLATRSNIAAITKAIGEKADHKRDLLFVYLASHGGRTAELATDLASYRSLQPISSTSTAEALQKSGVARRVIVISACFAATWIPALADDNTIVITAAAKDRTSFGCDDSRRLTVFGESFLGSLSVKNVSLHDAFEDAKRKISLEESKEKVTPSLPQVFVGRNMERFWIGQRDGHSDNSKPEVHTAPPNHG